MWNLVDWHIGFIWTLINFKATYLSYTGLFWENKKFVFISSPILQFSRFHKTEQSSKILILKKTEMLLEFQNKTNIEIIEF